MATIVMGGKAVAAEVRDVRPPDIDGVAGGFGFL